LAIRLRRPNQLTAMPSLTLLADLDQSFTLFRVAVEGPGQVLGIHDQQSALFYRNDRRHPITMHDQRDLTEEVTGSGTSSTSKAPLTTKYILSACSPLRTTTWPGERCGAPASPPDRRSEPPAEQTSQPR